MKRKFKRDYIIFEAKDMNYKYKDKQAPKAFGKIELNDEKYFFSLYVEYLKPINEGYNVLGITNDNQVLEIGNIILNQNGKNEKVFDLTEDEAENLKVIALTHLRNVALVGFKGSKLSGYEEILFPKEEYNNIKYVETREDYDEYEYIEIEEDDEETLNQSREFEERTYYEYVEVSEDEVSNYKEYDNISYVSVLNKRPVQSMEDENSDNNLDETLNKKVKKEEQLNSNKTQNQEESKEEKIAQKLLMPRQIKKGLKMFKEVKPFCGDYIDKSRWWKIEINPMTLCGYSMPNLGYINTLNYTMYSDTVLNSYKYRHYLFGVKYDEYNRRKYYVYAVPGKKDEQPDKGLTGFLKYQPCDNKNDNIGYWLCFVDCRTRKILKNDEK